LLTDSDLKKLGSLSKSNPQKKEWSAMKLYLLEQVRNHPPRLRTAWQDQRQGRMVARTAESTRWQANGAVSAGLKNAALVASGKASPPAACGVGGRRG